MSLTLTDLQALLAPAVEPVTLTSGKTVYVREVPSATAQEMGKLLEAATNENERLNLVAATYLADENGQPLCEPGNPEHMAVIAKLGLPNVRRVLLAGDRLNALFADGDEKKS